nr:solute carrier family 22 member 13-like [Dermacentor andersoni]
MLPNNPVPDEATAVRQENSYLAAQAEIADENIPFGEGAFQKRVLMISAFAGAISYAQNLLFRMSWHEMDHWCRRTNAFSNMSVAAWKELAIPRHPNGSYSRCTVRVPPDGGAWARVEPCVQWEFDLDEHGNTAVSEWSVVCQRRRLADAAQAAELVAMTITLLALGPIADRIGRKTVGVLALAAMLLTLAATGVATDLQTFIVVRSAAAASSAGLFVIRVLLYEITTTTRRLLYTTIGSALSFVIARTSVSFAHVLKASWSVWHMLLALFALVLLVRFRILVESPSWLITTHHEEEARRIALNIANINEVPLSHCLEFFKRHMHRAQHVPDGTTGTSQSSYVKRPNLRRTYVLTACIWTVLGLISVHYNTIRSTERSVYFRTLIDAGIAPLLVAVWPRLKNSGRVRKVAAYSALVFSSASALLFFAYTDYDTALSTSLLVVTRLASILLDLLEFYLTLAAFPTESRCTGSCVGLASVLIGNAIGLATFRVVLKRREDSWLVVQTALMAIAAMATMYMPSDDACLSRGMDSLAAASLPSKPSPLSAGQPACSAPLSVATEVQAKVSPPDARGAPKKKGKANKMPEQFAVRPSRFAANW